VCFTASQTTFVSLIIIILLCKKSWPN